MPDLRRLAALALLGIVALAAPGCLSPTLPLPPPENPDAIQEVEPGQWLVAGSCDDHALVTVFNLTRGQGVVRTCTRGTYAATIAGRECDLGFVRTEEGDETSPETQFQLEKIVNGTTTVDACR